MRLTCPRKRAAILFLGLAPLLFMQPTLSAQSTPKNLYLIALMGQSNMVGQGDLSELPPDFPKNPARIWNFTNAYSWEPAKEPLDSPQGQLDIVSLDEHPGVGPALAMADVFVASHPSVSVGLIPCAKGGSSISQWLKKPDQRPRSTLFGSCVNRIKTVSPANGTLRAAIFWQGARDGKTLDGALKWREQFTNFVNDLRSDLNIPDLPVVLIVLGRAEKNGKLKYPYWDVVREQQRAVDIPGVRKIEADGYERKEDGMHFTTKGQLAIGADLAVLLPRP
jgi:hypothetical protein